LIGGFPYLAKPVELKQLLVCIEQIWRNNPRLSDGMRPEEREIISMKWSGR